MIKILSLITVILLSYGCKEEVGPKHYYGTLVMFRYTGDNLFFVKLCQNSGLITGSSRDYKEYQVKIKCGNKTRHIWVWEKDIIAEKEVSND